ncbi:MAG: hypothetical protein JWR74_3214 [Polaromonas sp.]|nr:hypothetical protein [Polaromonas sp.]
MNKELIKAMADNMRDLLTVAAGISHDPKAIADEARKLIAQARQAVAS